MTIARNTLLLGMLLAALSYAEPKVSHLANNFSYIPPGLPNYGIAQGSILVIFGEGLAVASTPCRPDPYDAMLLTGCVTVLHVPTPDVRRPLWPGFS